MTLDQIKADLLYKDSLDRLAKGERDAKWSAGMKDVPVAKIIDAVNYIDKNLLPAIKKKSKGEDSADYVFFKNVIDYLLWAVIIADRFDHLEGRWVRQRVDVQLLREWVEFYEKELTKYTTVEDLLMTQSLDLYAKNIKKRAEDLLTTKKK